MKNRIYFFTGTGNSLKVAKDIALALDQSEVTPIFKGTERTIPVGLERIGFVFPVYYWGLPMMVADFMSHVLLSEQNETYIFAVATYGSAAVNAIAQAGTSLGEKGLHLNYGASLKTFSNYVSKYDMSPRLHQIIEKSKKKAVPIIQNIVHKKTSRIPPIRKILFRPYEKNMQSVHTWDQSLHIDKRCTSCEICQNICPAKNIIMVDSKPVFKHQCQRCQACIQHCPALALNYKDKTQNRRRYIHPDITREELLTYYK